MIECEGFLLFVYVCIEFEYLDVIRLLTIIKLSSIVTL